MLYGDSVVYCTQSIDAMLWVTVPVVQHIANASTVSNSSRNSSNPLRERKKTKQIKIPKTTRQNKEMKLGDDRLAFLAFQVISCPCP